MCWEIQIHIKLRPKAKLNLPDPAPWSENKLSLHGRFPVYYVEKNMCACDIVREGPGSIGKSMDIVEYLLNEHSVKQIHFCKSWNGNRKGDGPEEGNQKISLSEFKKLNQNLKLEEGIVYQIWDPDKYQWNY